MSSDKITSSCFYSLLPSVLALQWKPTRKVCQKPYHKPAWKCKLLLPETAWLLYSSTAFTASLDWLILFLLLGVKESITLGFCPFTTQTYIKACTEVQRQNSITSAQLLIHAEHPRIHDKFGNELGMRNLLIIAIIFYG